MFHKDISLEPTRSFYMHNPIRSSRVVCIARRRARPSISIQTGVVLLAESRLLTNQKHGVKTPGEFKTARLWEGVDDAYLPLSACLFVEHLCIVVAFVDLPVRRTDPFLSTSAMTSVSLGSTCRPNTEVPHPWISRICTDNDTNVNHVGALSL